MCPTQIAFAAMSKLKNVFNVRRWTARGKGLVLLNILVTARILHPFTSHTRHCAVCFALGIAVMWPSPMLSNAGGPLRLKLGGGQGLRRQLRPVHLCALEVIALHIGTESARLHEHFLASRQCSRLYPPWSYHQQLQQDWKQES